MDVFARIRYRIRLFELSGMGWLPLRVWRLGLGSIPRERGFVNRAIEREDVQDFAIRESCW